MNIKQALFLLDDAFAYIFMPALGFPDIDE